MPAWIESTPDGVRVTGPLDGYQQVFVFVSDDRMVASLSFDELAGQLQADKLLKVSPFGVSHMLGTGFIPMNDTIYDGVKRLGPGDWMTVTTNGDRLSSEIGGEYPWQPSRSRHDLHPDTAVLHQLIVAATDRQIEATGGEAVLMMSSGKDSVALAIAIADGGHDVSCITYKSRADDPEPVFAAQFSKTLGLDHRVVEIPEDPEVVRRVLLRHFESAVAPSVDHALVPTVFTLAASGLGAGAVIDGGGNDAYMGHLLSPRRLMKRRLRVRGRFAADLVNRVTRVDSLVNYLTRSRTAVILPGRNLRPQEIRRIYAEAVNHSEFWYDLSKGVAGLDELDATAVTLIRHTEGSRTNDKVRFAAPTFGLTPVLPYCDTELVDYYFHLPASAKYDTAARSNKVLLRQLLDEKIGYADSGVGDGYFSFDGASFLVANADFVRDEILSCTLWEPSIQGLAVRWLDALPRRPFLFHAVLALFLVSGWHNHSRYLDR